MKKRTKLVLVALCMLALLTGCYKQDTVISVSPTGNIHATVSFMGTDDAVAQVSQGGTFEDLKGSLMPQINQMITDTAKEKCEVISEDVDGAKLNGMKYTCYFKSFKELQDSQLFTAFGGSVAVPVLPGEAQEGIPGLGFTADSGFFGTTYKIAGTVSLTQGGEVSAEELEKLKTAKANLTFKFPFGSFSSSAGNKNIVKPTFVFNATSENDNIPVDVNVFVPNYLIILAILIFIGLIVAVVLMALTIKKLKAIIAGEGAEETDEVNAEEFVSEDDQQFFEGSDETVNFQEETEEVEEVSETEEKEEDDNDIQQ